MKPVFSSRDFRKKSRKGAIMDDLRMWKENLFDRFSALQKKSTQKHNANNQSLENHSLTDVFVAQREQKPHTITERSKQILQKIKLPWFQGGRHNQNPNKKTRGVFLRFLGKVTAISLIVGTIGIVGMFIYFSKDLPSPGKVNSRFIAESSKIYDRTGTVLLYDIHGEEKRTIIPLEEIPESIKQATIALEDQDFYNHHGIHFQSIARAALSQVFNIGTPSGGSTITQQLVKNSILTSERSLTRKIKEAILAIQIELRFSKDEILGLYLNEIPYGSNAYGVEAAAQTFFAKNAKDLTYDEAAVLASLPQAPSRYSPYGNSRERLKGRQEHAINQMEKLSYITPEQAQEYKDVDIFEKLATNRENINAPHMVIYVREYLEEKYGPEFLEKNGLTVITTIDWDKQQIAERIVKEKAFDNEKRYNAENAALVAIDPSNGDVLTMVGSRDYFDENIDGQVNVATAERQPGSSFKPYAYLLSFIKGYTPETILFDVPTKFDMSDQKDYEPKNYDGTFRGPVKIKEALGMSLNIPAVKALYLAGPKETITFAKSLGITTLNNPERYGLALVLGGGEVKLLDHVSAFGVFANNGIKKESRTILEIRDKEGNVIESASSEDGERVVEEKYIGMLSHVLSTNEYRIPTFGPNNALNYPNRPVAAKTGTTNENRDAWTVGYTPDIAIGVWVGNNDNRSMNSNGVGANAAAPIFRDFLNEAFPTPSGKKFPEYDAKKEETNKDILDGKLPDMKKIDVCEISEKKGEYCRENKYCPDESKKERSFANIHNILYYVKKDDPRGDEPKNPESDPQYDNWEEGVEEYYKSEDKIIFDEEPDECKSDDFDDYKPEIKIELSTSGNELKIKVDEDSPFDIESIEYIVDGKSVTTTKNDEYTYAVPADKNNSELSVEVILTDALGNKASATQKKSIAF